MKIKSLLVTLSAGVLLFATSCTKEVIFDKEPSNETASLSIKLVGEGLTTRATEATEAEQDIHTYTIYVFYPNGTLEAMKTGDNRIDGLTTGSKTIAVLTNTPAGFDPASITSLNDFNAATFDLDTQYSENLEDGLIMSGTSSETLTVDDNEVEVIVSRLVAKIKLGSITIAESTGHDKSKFSITAVHIMKAKGQAKIGAPNILDDADLYGGVDPDAANVTIVSQYRAYLKSDAGEGENDDYFYVFPNNSGDDATLMTIEGVYDEETIYFPFEINNKVVGDNANTGTYIKRNTQHTVNITLKKLGGGVDNPETLVDPANIIVTITPEDWTVVPGQGVEW